MSRSLLRGQTISVSGTGDSPEISPVSCVLAATKIISLQSRAARNITGPERYKEIAQLCLSIYVYALDHIKDHKKFRLTVKDAQDALSELIDVNPLEQQLNMMALATQLSTMATTPGFELTVINGLLTVTAYAQKTLGELLPDIDTVHVPSPTKRDYDIFRLLVVIGFERAFKVEDQRIITLTEELIDIFESTDGTDDFGPATRAEHQEVFRLVDTSMETLGDWYSGALSILETGLAFYSSDHADPLVDSLFAKMLRQRMIIRQGQSKLQH